MSLTTPPPTGPKRNVADAGTTPQGAQAAASETSGDTLLPGDKVLLS